MKLWMQIPLLRTAPNRGNGSGKERDTPRIPHGIRIPDERDGAAVRVQRDSNVHRMQDLRGKRTAAPDRFPPIAPTPAHCGLTRNFVQLP